MSLCYDKCVVGRPDSTFQDGLSISLYLPSTHRYKILKYICRYVHTYIHVRVCTYRYIHKDETSL